MCPLTHVLLTLILVSLAEHGSPPRTGATEKGEPHVKKQTVEVRRRLAVVD